MTGERFGRLTVISAEHVPDPAPSHAGKMALFASCRCDCGNLITTRAASLRSGNTRSCGCLHDEIRAAIFRTHGLRRHPLYVTWKVMRQRCRNPRNPGFKRWGGRGITICAEWEDAAAFITWIETNLGPRPDGMSLDRIDNDGNYEPGNVKWSTASEQARNRRRPRREA